MAIKRYRVTYAHLLRINKDGNPQFIINAINLVAFSSFTCRVHFYKFHSNKSYKILSVIEIRG